MKTLLALIADKLFDACHDLYVQPYSYGDSLDAVQADVNAKLVRYHDLVERFNYSLGRPSESRQMGFSLDGDVRTLAREVGVS